MLFTLQCLAICLAVTSASIFGITILIYRRKIRINNKFFSMEISDDFTERLEKGKLPPQSHEPKRFQAKTK